MLAGRKAQLQIVHLAPDLGVHDAVAGKPACLLKAPHLRVGDRAEFAIGRDAEHRLQVCDILAGRALLDLSAHCQPPESESRRRSRP